MRRLALLALLSLAACSKAPTVAPHQIHIAGSSAGYLLSTEVAERLMREDPDVLAPLVRAGGTGEGIARFCDPDNPTRPDILITTRRLTAEEQARCAANGSTDIEQREIGFTSPVLVVARGSLALPGLLRSDVTTALTSSAKNWSDIRSGLPVRPIILHGPTPKVGIADTLYGSFLGDTQRVRSDTAYTGHGADADLVARTVMDQPGSVGIIPLAQAQAHADTLSILPLYLRRDTPEAKRLPPVDPDVREQSAIPLLLVYRQKEINHVPGLSQLIAFYADALRHNRRDIAPPRIRA